ncbi:MAG: RNA polymerase sigma factor [Candidatus Cyclobacteriaceae bacterium M3_2C_046]
MDRTNQDPDIDFAFIINQYKELAFNIALKITRNEQDAEEIVQDSFVKAFAGLGSFQKKSSFSTWFYRIVYNTSLSHVRKHKLPTVEMNQARADEQDHYGVEQVLKNLNSKDRKMIISRALGKLNELDYTLLSLFYYENLSLKEIAKIIGKKPGYMKVLLQRARIKLIASFSSSEIKELKELL